MRYPSRIRQLAVLTALVILSKGGFADESDAAKLVDEILVNPGFFDQMCAIHVGPQPEWFSGYGFDRGGMAFVKISVENFERLRKVRAEALSVLANRLREAAPEAEALQREFSQGVLTGEWPKFQVVVPVAEDSGNVGDQPVPAHPLTVEGPFLYAPGNIEIFFAMVLDLNGVEILPELLRLEELLDAEAPYKIAPSQWDRMARSPRDSEDRAKFDRGPVTHHHCLTVICSILANEGYKPFMDAFLPNFDSATRGEHNVGIRYRISFAVENRDSVIALARRFLDEVPPDRRLGAKGMINPPVPR